jgi:hypothetical protein
MRRWCDVIEGFVMSETDEDAEVRRVLGDAGWTPTRRDAQAVDGWRQMIDSPGGFQMFPAARGALEEFGGLRVDRRGPGINRAKSSFRIDPTVAKLEYDRFHDFESELGVRLYPLGEVDDGHAYLAVDESGRAYLLMEELFDQYPSVLAALASFIVGRRGRPE